MKYYAVLVHGYIDRFMINEHGELFWIEPMKTPQKWVGTIVDPARRACFKKVLLAEFDTIKPESLPRLIAKGDRAILIKSGTGLAAEYVIV